MNVPSVPMNLNGLYMLLRFQLSKLYERFRQPAFFFWPIISQKITAALELLTNFLLMLSKFIKKINFKFT